VRRARLLCAVTLILAATAPAAARAQGTEVAASMGDDFFDPDEVPVAVGGTVTWTNDGRNPHTVIADDGSFDSGRMEAGDTFTLAFDEPGVHRFYCRYHGGPGGLGMAGAAVVGVVGPGPGGQGAPPEAPPAGAVIRVPEAVPTIQEAVDAAAPGDLILIGPGVYHEGVRVTTPFLTIRGTDRDDVVLEGDFERPNGIHVLDAPGVAVENVTARHFTLNGLFWTGLQGYRASYVTTYANGDYGVYAYNASYGQVDHAYASGHPDSGLYIGECQPCHAVIVDSLSENNALGYSGTNAGGDLWVVNSIWRNNMGGIVPNTLDTERLAPQRGAVVAGNLVYDNNNLDAPAKSIAYPSLGIGILVAGGRDNVVRDNRVSGHRHYGIAVVPNVDENVWFSGRNRVVRNRVDRSGIADLAVGGPAMGGNCFADNAFETSLPIAIELTAGCGGALNRLGGGDLSVSLHALSLFADAGDGEFPHGDWTVQRAPPDQLEMPGDLETWTPGASMPGPRPVIRVPEAPDGALGPDPGSAVSVLGVPFVGATPWELLLGLYGYVLPLVLYAAWVSVALWDLVRRDGLRSGARLGWLAVVLIVPFLGPLIYLAFGKSEIPRSVRIMLVAGSLAAYAAFTLLVYLLASI